MQGNIKLDGHEYRVLSYRTRDVTDFSPKASTPGGAVSFSELGLYQIQSQTDWRHGFGDTWYTDEAMYMHTNGNLDTRHPGIVMMFTKSTASDTDDNVKEGFVNWNNALYAYGTAGLRKYSGGSWSSIYSAAAVNGVLPSGDYLFFLPDENRIQKLDTSDVVTDTGNDSNSVDYKWINMHSGYVYAGKDGTNRVHRDSDSTLAELEGTTIDTNVIYIGTEGSAPTLGAVVYAGYLYFFKRDGLWVLGDDLIAKKSLDFTSEESSDNFRSWIVYNGYLYFPIRDVVYQWNGARLTDVTPPRLTDSFPYTTYGRFDNFISANRFLYCTARTNETIWSEDLLCYDGVSWSKLCRLTENGSDTVTAIGYDTVNARMWYHVNATADVTYYIPFQSGSEYPYADFPTTGSHSLYLARWSAGYRRVQKSMSSIIVEASNLTSTRKLSIYYSLDGADFVKWDDITKDGITELTYPGGSTTKEFYYIILRIDFETGTAAQSPILESISLRFIMRPEEIYGWNMSIPIAKDLEVGHHIDGRMPKETYDDIKEARNSKSPIEFIDIYGESYLVYITSITLDKYEMDENAGGSSTVSEQIATLNLVEAK